MEINTSKKPTPKIALKVWGVSSIGMQLLTNMDSTFFSYFLTDVAMFPVALSGLIMTATSSIDLFISIFIGGFIGMMKPMKWGRLRSCQLIFPPLLIILYPLHYTVVGNGIGAAIFMIIVYILGHICTTTAYTADFAMIQELAATPQDRIKLNANRMVGSNIGRLITSYAVPTVVLFVKGFATEQSAYLYLAVAWSIVFTITYWIHFKIGDGYENQSRNAKIDDTLKIKDIIIAFSTNKNLAAIVLSDLSSNVGSFVIPALNVYYYKYVASSMPNAGLATHLMCSSLMGLFGAYLAGIIGKRVREKRTVLLYAYAGVSILLIVSRLVALVNAYLFFTFQIIMQAVVGFTQPLESDLYMDVAVYHEWKTGKNCTAFIMGLLNIPVKLSAVIKSFVITMILSNAGYVAGMPVTPEFAKDIVNGYIGAPLLAPIIGLLVLGFVFSLRADKVEKMQQEIFERKNQPDSK